MTAHVNYQPNEYESMLIAAGWIAAEDVDPEYQEYIGKHRVDAIDYDGWLYLRQEWNDLELEYQRDFGWRYDTDEVYFNNPMNSTQQKREQQVLNRMSYIECVLGY